jgi:hypothetical protein
MEHESLRAFRTLLENNQHSGGRAAENNLSLLFERCGLVFGSLGGLVFA